MEDFPLFVVPDVELTGCLSEEESHHASRVLRMQVGDRMYVTNGAGDLYLAELREASGKELPVQLIEKVPVTAPSHPELHMAVTPLKNADRTEWLLEKLVEVGLGTFSLVMTERTVRKHIKMQRLEKVMLAAMKQSRKRTMTQLTQYESLDEFCDLSFSGQKFIAYCGEEYPKQELAKVLKPAMPTLVLIGPEGDFTPEEVRRAVECGFVPVSLGQERLRSETAAMYAGMLHHILNTQAE